MALFLDDGWMTGPENMGDPASNAKKTDEPRHRHPAGWRCRERIPKIDTKCLA